MREAGADGQLVVYGRVVRSCSNPDADAAGLEGVACDALAAGRAGRLASSFLEEVDVAP
jgi:hypothetical protein